MCARSVIMDYGKNMPIDNWNQQVWTSFQSLIAQADIFDSLAQQPDCEDASKSLWIAQVQEYLRKLSPPGQ